MRNRPGQGTGCRLGARLMVLAVCVAVLTSCGMFRHKDKQPMYYSAAEMPPLKIPPGLDRPISGSALIITTPEAPLPQKEMKAVPPRIASQSAGGKRSTTIHWSPDGAYLLVQDTQESVYRRLGFVIERSELSMSDVKMDDGYRFDFFHDPKDPDRGFFSKLAFWRHDGPNYSGSYLAITQADGDNTRIFIKNDDGTDADPDAAEYLLNIIGQRLG